MRCSQQCVAKAHQVLVDGGPFVKEGIDTAKGGSRLLDGRTECLRSIINDLFTTLDQFRDQWQRWIHMAIGGKVEEQNFGHGFPFLFTNFYPFPEKRDFFIDRLSALSLSYPGTASTNLIVISRAAILFCAAIVCAIVWPAGNGKLKG